MGFRRLAGMLRWGLVICLGTSIAAACILFLPHFSQPEHGDEHSQTDKSVAELPDKALNRAPECEASSEAASDSRQPDPPLPVIARITGTVRYAIGCKPVEGASLEFMFWEDRINWVRTTTDSAGRYELALAKPSRGRLEVGCEKHIKEYRDFSCYAEKDLIEEDFYLAPQDGVRGRVVDESGAPVAGAQIFANLEEQTYGRCRCLDSLNCVTGPDGKFEIWDEIRSRWQRSEYRRLIIMHNAYCEKIVDLKGMPEESNLVEAGDIVLSGGLSVSGTVRDPAGSPITDATVIIGDLSEFPPIMTGDDLQKTVKTNGAGRYTITGLEQGEYQIRAFSETLPPGEAGVVKVEKSLSNVDITLPWGGEIRGTVQYSDGTPIQNCDVYIDQPGGRIVKFKDSNGKEHTTYTVGERGKYLRNYWGGPLAEDEEGLSHIEEFYRITKTDAKGECRLTGIPLDEEFKVTSILPNVTDDGARRNRRRCSQRQKACAGDTVNFRFRYPGSISGTLVDGETGERFTGKRRIRVWTPESHLDRIPVDALTGKFHAKYVNPGTVRIFAETKGYAQAEVRVELAEGEDLTGVELPLHKRPEKPAEVHVPGPGIIRGEVVDGETGLPLAGAEVAVLNRAGEWSVKTDPGGLFEVAGLAGKPKDKDKESDVLVFDYKLRVTCEGYAPETVRREKGEDGERHRIILWRSATIKGKVISSDPRCIVKSIVRLSSTGSFDLGVGEYFNIRESSGNFEFPGLKPGKHYLRWDGRDAVEVEVTAGETKTVNLQE